MSHIWHQNTVGRGGAKGVLCCDMCVIFDETAEMQLKTEAKVSISLQWYWSISNVGIDIWIDPPTTTGKTEGHF